MKSEPKFYICKHCGNIVTFLKESGAPLTCCGDLMTQLIPNSVDAANEKHVPQVTVEGDDVIVSNAGTVGDELMALGRWIVVLPADESAAVRTACPWPGITKHTDDAGRCAAQMRGD